MSNEVVVLSRKFRESLPLMRDFLEARNCTLAEIEPEYPLTEDAICELAATAGGIITGLEPITARVMDAAPNLKVISTGGVGFDHVDCEAAAERGIVVGNCHGCNNHSVSELAFGMMLNLARKVHQSDAAIRSEGWVSGHAERTGIELWGKTLGVVGLGRVGKASALLGRAFGMNVIANDIVWDVTFANEHGISLAPLEKLLRVSDFVTLHVPLTVLTREFIDEDALELMKPTAFLINTARGPVVKESALVNALANGRIAGAGLDVFRVEPHPDNPYVEFDNVILTPHIGGSSAEAEERSLYLAMTNVANVLNGHEPHNRVN